MVNSYGEWTPEKDYSTFPKNKWCDLDRVANYIIQQGYVPKTSLENLTYMVTSHFQGEVEDKFSSYAPEYNDDGVYNLTGMGWYVEATGGLQEFDYEP